MVPKPIPLCDLRAQHESLRHGIEDALARVCARGDFILGREVGEFEKAFAATCGTAECVGVANGTDALRLALEAMGVRPGDEVVIPAFTFVATGTAVVQAGARPVCADVLPDTLCLDPRSLAAAITPRTRAVMPVHLFGQPADWEGISKAAKGLPLLEDACQAHGAMLGKARCGSLGRAAAFSFFPAKNLGCYGDGGAVTTSDPELAAKVRLLRNCGRTAKYDHPEQGINSRLDTLQAAVLLEKLPGLDARNASRRRVAARYRELLKDVEGLRLPAAAPGTEHVWHQFVIRAPRRDDLAAALKAEGIETGIHYPKPVHLQGAFAHLGYREGAFPVSEAAAREVLSLPVYPEIADADVERVASAIRAFHLGKRQAGGG